MVFNSNWQIKQFQLWIKIGSNLTCQIDNTIHLQQQPYQLLQSQGGATPTLAMN